MLKLNFELLKSTKTARVQNVASLLAVFELFLKVETLKVETTVKMEKRKQRPRERDSLSGLDVRRGVLVMSGPFVSYIFANVVPQQRVRRIVF